jgi:hypothetical protein
VGNSSDFIQAVVTGPEWMKNSGLQKIVRDGYTEALAKSLKNAKKIMQDEIEASGATASKVLFNSVAEKINNSSFGSNIFSGQIYFRSPADIYADNADKGRRPGKVPPSQQILSWMKIKGIDEKFLWPIMLQLAKKGTQNQFWSKFNRRPFIDSAVEKIDANIKEEFEKASDEIKRKIDNASAITFTETN